MAVKKFEEALQGLEEIVRKMEEGNMTLEKSLKSFEEGIKLSRFCAKKLDEAERKVEILLRGESGIKSKPFGGEEKDGE